VTGDSPGPAGDWRFRDLTSWSAVVALLVAICAPTLPAHADETGADQMAQAAPAKVASGDALQEIVVTARYKAENQQKIPISMTTLNADEIAARGLTSTLDLTESTPNVTIAPSGGVFGKTAAIYIRGVGLDDSDFAYDPAVGVYVDDVYQGTAFGSIFSLSDIDRVEVLRGPQGTLFGKNSEGGAIRLFTPEATGDDSGSVSVGYGSYNREIMRGDADVSLVKDKLFLRVSFGIDKSDGYFNLLDYICMHPQDANKGTVGLKPQTTSPGCQAGTEGGDDSRLMRAKLRWLATDDIEVKLSGSLLDDQGESNPDKLVYVLPNAAASAKAGSSLGVFNSLVYLPLFGLPIDQRFLTGSNSYTSYAVPQDALTGLTVPNESNIFSYSFSGDLDWRTPWDGITVRDIMGYQNYHGDWGVFSEGSPLPVNLNDNMVSHEQFSEELQINGTALLKALEWTAGAYYYDAHSYLGGLIDVAPLAYLGLLPAFTQNDPVTDKNTSGFVHGIYHATDNFSIEAGLRYSDQDKVYTFNHTYVYPYAIAGTPVPGLDNLVVNSGSHRIDPKLAVQYQWNPSVMTYAEVATGSKGGGVSARPVTADEATPFKPEELTSFEIGAKTQWFDDRLRFNGDFFVSDYRNLQQSITKLGEPGNYTINTGHVLMDGVEAEIKARPVANLQVDATVGYLKYRTLSLGAAADDPLGPTMNSQPEYSPKLKLSIGAQYNLNFGDSGIVVPRVDWSWQSTEYFDVQNNPPGVPETAFQPGYGLVNVRLGWNSADGKLSASLSVRNLTNKFYYVSMLNVVSSFGYVEGQPGMPRTILFIIKRSW
jgi:iron complex outermembrane recepter protein